MDKDFETLVKESILPGDGGDLKGKLFLDYVWESGAVDWNTYGDLTAVQIGIVVPEGLIRKYNKLERNVDSKKLPDAQTFFEKLRPLLEGRHLTPRRTSVEYRDFDDADRELKTYNFYECRWYKDGGELILEINGDLELDEEYVASFVGGEPEK